MREAPRPVPHEHVSRICCWRRCPASLGVRLCQSVAPVRLWRGLLYSAAMRFGTLPGALRPSLVAIGVSGVERSVTRCAMSTFGSSAALPRWMLYLTASTRRVR